MILKVVGCEQSKKGYVVRLRQDNGTDEVFAAKLFVDERMIEGEEIDLVAMSKQQQILLKIATHKAYGNMLVKDLLKLSYNIVDSDI